MGYVIGVDEVGRGALAGDVYTAGVLALADTTPVVGVGDSKTLTAARRSVLAPAIQAHPGVRWVLAKRTSSDIDERGIGKTVVECFQECIQHLLLNAPGTVDKIVVDGVPVWEASKYRAPSVFLPKADATVWVVSAASILAKVARDGYMDKLALEAPAYGWAKNKGYGTAEHIQALRNHGLSVHHRKKFARTALGLREPPPAEIQITADPVDIEDLFGLK